MKKQRETLSSVSLPDLKVYCPDWKTSELESAGLVESATLLKLKIKNANRKNLTNRKLKGSTAERNSDKCVSDGCLTLSLRLASWLQEEEEEPQEELQEEL